MKKNLEEAFESIPDYEEFLGLVDEIAKVSLEKMDIERAIKAKEAETVMTVNNNKDYWQNGKPPAMNFIDATYKFTGLSGELLEYRNSLAGATAELDRLKLRLSVYKDMLEVWRTLSANETLVSNVNLCIGIWTQ